MVQAVTLIQRLTDLPLVIDSSIPEVLEAGLATYQGKALVNSVTAEDERLHTILPLVKRYGAAVIGLPNDEEQIPDAPEDRLVLTRKLIRTATDTYQIPIEDIVIDPLAMPVGAGHRQHHAHAGDPRAGQGGVRRQHHLRRVQPVLRHARPARAHRGVPPARRRARPDQRDHGRPHARRWSPPRGPPTCCSATTTGAPPGSPRSAPRRRPGQLRPCRPGSVVSQRVDLRFNDRPVRVPQGVTLFDAASWNGIAIDSTCGGHGTCKKCRIRFKADPPAPDQPRPARLHRGRDQGRLAARLPHPGEHRRRHRGAAADHPAQGGHRRRRPPGHPPPRRPQALPGARRAVARRPGNRPRAGARRADRPRPGRRPRRAARPSAARCARRTSRSPRSSRTRR